jgi:KUP system potassium uptake protein
MFIQHVDDSVNKVTGTAVFLTGTPNVVPHALLHNLKHNKILHERNVLVTVDVQDIPYVSKDDRFLVEQLELDFFRIKLNYGFKEQLQ